MHSTAPLQKKTENESTREKKEREEVKMIPLTGMLFRQGTRMGWGSRWRMGARGQSIAARDDGELQQEQELRKRRMHEPFEREPIEKKDVLLKRMQEYASSSGLVVDGGLAM